MLQISIKFSLLSAANAKIKMRRYVIFSKLQKFDTQDIKHFTVVLTNSIDRSDLPTLSQQSQYQMVRRHNLTASSSSYGVFRQMWPGSFHIIFNTVTADDTPLQRR